MIGVVRGKAFRSVKERVNPCFAQYRHAVDGLFQNGFEMIEILGQLVKFEIFWDAVHRPWLGHGFKGTQHQFTCINLVIRAFVGHAQNGQLFQSRDGFGHNIEMFTRM